MFRDDIAQFQPHRVFRFARERLKRVVVDEFGEFRRRLPRVPSSFEKLDVLLGVSGLEFQVPAVDSTRGIARNPFVRAHELEIYRPHAIVLRHG